MQELIKKLKAPKEQYNSFGKYKYRSCEAILEAVKPLLAERGMILNLSDEVVSVGGANYVKATATIITKDGSTYEAHGWAREDFEKKGMDAPQMTGTASSYARKYALNGLLCIDDTKDADTDEYRTENQERLQQQQQPKRNALTLEQAKANELGFMSWLYSKYQLNKAMDATKVVAEFYDCDYATVCWLRDQFAKYVKQMENK